ncbi:hypothetical protein M0805_003825 [Coniferiporia weirii]|nr:hypothetical protein M0805_003825 [Coniferiporia weirii]
MMLVLLLKVAVLLCTVYSMVSWLRSFWRRRSSGWLPYPPGPKGLPLVGNILDIPNAGELEKARGWKRQYGDVVFFETLGKKFILLNSYEAAFELFEKRSHNYSSRPYNIVFELAGWDRMPTMMPYCDEHRKSRQMMQRFFGQSAVVGYHRLQTQVTHRLLLGLLEGRGDFRDLTRRAVGEAIMMIAYGYKVSEDNDPYVDLADRGMRSGVEAERLILINVFPWIRYLPECFPGTAFHRVIREGREFTQAILYKAHEMTKKRIYDGSAVPSMTSKLVEAHSTENGDITDEDIIAESTAVVNIAGTDTTVSTLNTLYLTMILYPDAQRRGQEELDSVIGKGNLPTMEDRPNLPYIEAICNELSRWQPVGPLGIPHFVTKDDVYKGYFIPAGTTIISNVWAILRDPAEYPQPEKFMPERRLSTKGGKAPMDVSKVAFGFGRRICLGRYFAESSIFITVASVLAAFNIEEALDANGVPITPTATFVRHPKPFQCKLTPRSDKIALAIQQAVDSANDPPVTVS